jgi:aryl sulfotransferase
MAQGITWPVKTREIHNVVFDSSVWNDFKFRADDIVIATWAKAGTTWTQQIIAQLLFAGEQGLPVADMSPWLDLPGSDRDTQPAGSVTPAAAPP